ncbi:MAG: hypothetical protein PUG54_01865 [Firmicutes bacterium]|nr:hypothetical protein [Bacillota bacterium]
MKKLRQLFQEKIILSAMMCVLLLVVLVTATYSWYAINNSARTYDLQLKTGGIGGIKVAVKPGGPDIMTDEAGLVKNADGIPVISFQLKKFENINGGKGGEIAPGAYGTLPFYITALAQNIKTYSIKVQLKYELSEKAKATLTAEQKANIEKWIRDHIMVYQKKETTAGGIVKFSEPLTYYVEEKDAVPGAKGNLKYNEEVKAEIYWSWNYELTDHPNYQSIERFPTHTDTSEAARQAAVRKYDEEDTLLGNCIEKVWINVYIEGKKEGE